MNRHINRTDAGRRGLRRQLRAESTTRSADSAGRDQGVVTRVQILSGNELQIRY
jgi:hypothetical protein